MHVYQLPASLYSFKLRLALALKGVTIEMRDPPEGSYQSPSYKAINPAGTIPALVDGDLMIAETDAIIEYLEDLGLGRPIFPQRSADKARMRMISRWNDLQLEPAVRRLFGLVAGHSRKRPEVSDADGLIRSKLLVVEAGLDPSGPFATGVSPGMADCGLAASLVWLAPLSGPLQLTASPGPRLERLAAAMAMHPLLANEVESYGALVRNWVSNKSSG